MFPLFPTWQIVATPGAGRIAESKSAAYLFLGPSCNRGLGTLDPAGYGGE